MSVNIEIFQGKCSLPQGDINIVIDVLRAFTVSHYAFLSDVKEIQLIDTIEKGLAYKSNNAGVILSGEVQAYKITEFDIGNSPYSVAQIDMSGKTLGQKTTNGVAVTLNSLNAKEVFVTGFTNAYSTALHVRELSRQSNKDHYQINIIASHPTGDDDLACAEFLKHFIEDIIGDIQSAQEDTVLRIIKSEAAQKFLLNQEFSILDLMMCTQPMRSDFVMKVQQDNDTMLPTIIREKNICMD